MPQNTLAQRESEHQRHAREHVSLNGPEVLQALTAARAEQRVDCEETMAALREQLHDRVRCVHMHVLIAIFDDEMM